MKKILGIHDSPRAHWVGDGFPVRTLFSYDAPARQTSPFLLLDYAGPAEFAPADAPRGVGQHPHRGFETVTIVYQGEVAHRDSSGGGGTIGPGDVQWMTAAAGIVHQEFHSPEFTRQGGMLEMVQLWVNLPARHKMAQPGYQSLLNADIPVVALPGDAGKARIIAGGYQGASGAARTFTPINVWDLQLNPDRPVMLPAPEGHTSALVVLHGTISINGTHMAREAQLALLDRAGTGLSIEAKSNAAVLFLSGEPIDEPVVGHGPFVMNTQNEIVQAIKDYSAGRLA
jgi:redox-sensitive bicupin YhaK (pirin superfamily)